MPRGQAASFRIGAARITRHTEIVFDDFAPETVLPDWEPQAVEPSRAWLDGRCVRPDGRGLIVAVNTWIVETSTRTIVIDTGIGDGRTRRFPPFDDLHTGYLDRLRATGIDPLAVTHVICTHLHTDHVGWNTRRIDGAWRPSFPHARYLWSRGEQAAAGSEATRAGPAAGVYEDSILPIVEAGLVDLVDDAGGEVLDGICFHPTPGHSPGHMSVSLISEGQEALFAGDVVHNPIQIVRPDWNSIFCEDPERALVSRRWALDHAADRHALFLPAHFGGSGAGNVSRNGDGFRWRFA